MKTIMLICAAGLSTSLLVSKMKKAAEENGIQADIFAAATDEVDTILQKKSIDCLLLGPQVRYMEKKFAEKLAGRHIPVDTIKMQYYGMMDGSKVLAQALKLIDGK